MATSTTNIDDLAVMDVYIEDHFYFVEDLDPIAVPVGFDGYTLTFHLPVEDLDISICADDIVNLFDTGAHLFLAQNETD